MTGRRKKLGIAAAVLLGLLAIAYLVLIRLPASGDGCRFVFDLPQIRALAEATAGPKPTDIRVERISTMHMPLAVASVGLPWDTREIEVFAYQVVFPDRTIIVDTALSLEQAKEVGATEGYDAAAFGRVRAAMQEAAAVVVTHEHVDHLGGALAGPPPPGLRLTPAQVASHAMNKPELPASVVSAPQLADLAYQALAPGVVLIKAPGHTPGSQMVYVRRADGAEVILTGDTAWIVENIEREQGPVLFVAMMMGSERAETTCQLRALKGVQGSIAVMPGHDRERMRELIGRGIFVQGFLSANRAP